MTSVAMVTRWGAYCGMDAYGAELVAALMPSIDVTVLANSDESAPRGGAVRRSWRTDSDDIKATMAAIEDIRPDVVHVQYNWGYMTLGFLNQLASAIHASGLRLVIQLHRTAPFPGGPTLQNVATALSAADVVVVHNDGDVQAVREFVTGRVWRWRLGESPRDLPHRGRAREALGIGQDVRPLLCTFGFMQPRKGLLRLVDAMSLLADEYPTAGLIALSSIHPRDFYPEYYRDVMSAVRNSPARSRIRIVDDFLPVEAPLLIMRASDLVVFPYLSGEEGTSAAAKMAAAAGTALLVSDEPMFDEVKPSAAVLECASPAGIASTVTRIMRDASELERLEAAARGFVEQSAWPTLALEYAETLRGLGL